MQQNDRAVNDLPVAIVGICLIVLAVELMLTAATAGLLGGAGGVGWRLEFVQQYSFVPAVIDVMQ